jgi:Fe-S-cluster containining protein
MGTVLCEHCTGVCCKYVALPLDPPEDKRDYDDIRWYVMHEGILVFVEDGDWYLQVQTPCKNLREDNLCGIYETRPQICREYKADGCDYTGGDYGYDLLFTHPEEVEAYARKSLKQHKNGSKKKKSKRSKPRPKGYSVSMAAQAPIPLRINGRK